MADLLTTKQVQEYLQVDRTTIYRMLNDGRLTGVKVGQQWRFPRSTIDTILEGGIPTPEEEKSSISSEILPIHCIQVIQDVFAEVAGVGSVTTTKKGEPLTTISNSCQFCNLIHASETGYQACVNTWKELANLPPTEDITFFTCHAGMQYAYSPINIDGEFSALLIAGQYHLEPPAQEKVAMHIRKLAQQHGINEDELTKAAKDISVLNERIHSKIGKWLQRVAVTLGEISSERAELMDRLSRIAKMTKIES
jgi:excisionase family DNA binding protein